MTGDAATAYAKEVVAADFEEAGDGDVVRKVLGDLTAKGVAMTEPRASRQDGRADGAGRRAGEGGDVRSANRERANWRMAIFHSLLAIRHSPTASPRTISSNRRDAALRKPPRRVTATTSWLAARSPTRMVEIAEDAQFFGGVALRQQRDAEAGLDQTLLRGQAVDRRPRRPRPVRGSGTARRHATP